MERLTRQKAIRAKCLDCCAGQAAEVRHCTCLKCALYPYRLGHESTECYTNIPQGTKIQKERLGLQFFSRNEV